MTEQASRRGGREWVSMRSKRMAVRVRRYRRDESGSILIFGLFSFMIIIMVCGLSLDFMHYEAQRTSCQATMDRAVLAAADLSNSTPSQDVVNDYFAKTGLCNYKPTVTETYGSLKEWKSVSGTVQVDVPTWFMSNFGVPKLSGPTVATAQEAVGNVEISMVLDISGSMGNTVWDLVNLKWVAKLLLLKPAAANFVDMMFKNVAGAGGSGGNLMISIVPYSQQVNLGTASNSLASQLNLTTEHNKGGCVDLAASDFNTLAVTPTQQLARTAWADVRYTNSSPYFRECWGTGSTPVDPVLAFSQDKQALINKIYALSATGDTAIDIGAKWGMALLDPAIRPALNAMIPLGSVSSTLKDHPTNYDAGSTLKVMVVMTDGENTNSYRLKNYRSGNSNLVWKKTAGQTCYWNVCIPNGSTVTSYYWYDSTQSSTKKYYSFDDKAWQVDPTGTTTMTWQQVWDTWSVSAFASNYAGKVPGITASSWLDGAVDHADSDDKDARLKSVCDQAKAKGVTIFTIAFGASAQGKKALLNCASTPAHYYESSGADISDAFAGIANTIRKLKLTQ